MDGESTPLLSSAKGGKRFQAPLHHSTVQQDDASRPATTTTTRRRILQFGKQQQQEQSRHFSVPFDESPLSSPTAADDDKTTGLTTRLGQILSSGSNKLRDWLFPPSRVVRNQSSGLPPVDKIVYRDNDNTTTTTKQYYQDEYNDLPFKCSFGTNETDGIWMNRTDLTGIIMSAMVWLLIIYSGVTVVLLAQNNSLSDGVQILYCTLCALALASHAKTTFTDPGSVPQSAVPTIVPNQLNQNPNQYYTLCRICYSYKPKKCHHCRICNRCICGMDHHCPWMNNCIGSGNYKHFILFLLYVWCLSAYALFVLELNYFFCATDKCIFPPILIQMVRVVTVLSVGALLFSSQMLMTVTWGILTGTGMIDRIKLGESSQYSDEESTPLKDVFGIGKWYTWWLPIDPLFEDYDHVMKYSTTQRLLREQTTATTCSIIRDSNNTTPLSSFDQI